MSKARRVAVASVYVAVPLLEVRRPYNVYIHRSYPFLFFSFHFQGSRVGHSRRGRGHRSRRVGGGWRCVHYPSSFFQSHSAGAASLARTGTRPASAEVTRKNPFAPRVCIIGRVKSCSAIYHGTFYTTPYTHNPRTIVLYNTHHLISAFRLLYLQQRADERTYYYIIHYIGHDAGQKKVRKHDQDIKNPYYV